MNRAKTPKSNPEPEPEPEPDDDLGEDETSKLRKELNQLKQDRENEREVQRINNELTENRQKHDLTKNNPKIAKLVDLITYANINVNPQSDLGRAYGEIVGLLNEAIEEMTEKKRDNNHVLNNRMRPVQRGGGSTPNIEAEKKLDRHALKDGTAKQGFQDLLQQILQEKGEA